MESHHKTSSWVLSPGKKMIILQMSADFLSLTNDFLFRATNTSIERKLHAGKDVFPTLITELKQ